MTDIVDKETRSRMMSGIRGKDTKPELLVRSYLHRSGLRYRIHDATLPGKPDIVLRKHNAIVEVRGCFWHRHQNCKKAYIPKSRQEFWLEKFEKNVSRDLRNDSDLKKQGWRVFVIWECELDDPHLENLKRKILSGERNGT